MKVLILLAVAASALLHSGSVWASNSYEVAVLKTVQAVESARRSKVTAARNLNEMRNSLPASEGEAVGNVVHETWLVFETAGRIVIAGDIYRDMKANDDKATVVIYFVDAAKHYSRQMKLSLPWLNECLVQIKAPAALAEATKVRDKMIEALTAAELFVNIGT